MNTGQFTKVWSENKVMLVWFDVGVCVCVCVCVCVPDWEDVCSVNGERGAEVVN